MSTLRSAEVNLIEGPPTVSPALLEEEDAGPGVPLHSDEAAQGRTTFKDGDRVTSAAAERSLEKRQRDLQNSREDSRSGLTELTALKMGGGSRRKVHGQ